MGLSRGWTRLRDLVYRVETQAGSVPVRARRATSRRGHPRRRPALGPPGDFTDVSNGRRRVPTACLRVARLVQPGADEIVTLWLLATDDLSRPTAELEPLLKIIESTRPGAGRRRVAREAMAPLDLCQRRPRRCSRTRGSPPRQPGPAGQRGHRLRRPP